MEFRKLQVFSKVYELQSFSRAGQELFLSQPTISTHILSLEAELKVQLFDRIGRRIIPTRAGEVLYQKTKDIFRALERAKSDIHELTNQVSGTVIIGGSTIPSNYLLPSLLASFKQKFPDVCVDMRIGDSIQISQDVLSGNLDFGMVGGYAGHFDLENSLLLTDELMVVVSPGLVHNFKNSLQPKDLLDVPWVMREKGSGTRQALEKAVQKHGIDISRLPVKALVQTTEALVRCVLAGVGIGVTSRLAVHEHIQSGALVEMDVENLSMQREFYLIKHKRRTLFLCAGVLMRHIQQYIDDGGIVSEKGLLLWRKESDQPPASSQCTD